MWSTLMRRHLSDHPLWTIFQSSVTQIPQLQITHGPLCAASMYCLLYLSSHLLGTHTVVFSVVFYGIHRDSRAIIHFRYLNVQPSHVTYHLNTRFTMSGIQMNLVLRCPVFRQLLLTFENQLHLKPDFSVSSFKMTSWSCDWSSIKMTSEWSKLTKGRW